VAASLNNLAGLNENQGQYGRAEPIFQLSLAISEKALGKPLAIALRTPDSIRAICGLSSYFFC
jgi:Tetratricopeptide repeat